MGRSSKGRRTAALALVVVIAAAGLPAFASAAPSKSSESPSEVHQQPVQALHTLFQWLLELVTGGDLPERIHDCSTGTQGGSPPAPNSSTPPTQPPDPDEPEDLGAVIDPGGAN